VLFDVALVPAHTPPTDIRLPFIVPDDEKEIGKQFHTDWNFQLFQ